MTAHEELFEIARVSEASAHPPELEAAEPSLNALETAVKEVGRSFSGSWLGYHSRVYYAGLQPAPPGAHFSQEWGLKEMFTDIGTCGDWREHDPEDVKRHIREMAGNPDLSEVRNAADRAAQTFGRSKSDILSIFSDELDQGSDKFLSKLKDDLEAIEPLSKSQITHIWWPEGQIMTRDSVAVGQGNQVPPHTEILAEVSSIRQAFNVHKAVADISTKAASHLERKARRARRDERVGTNVFIGHGRSLAWREIKDFIHDRLRLPWDEFNRVPVAGVTNIARLSEMMDAAAVAFLIMTAEDEMADGGTQARMNVIHEAGLFQGRLGFTKAIVLLEDGCQEFSNIQGLGQIRFPRGQISATFEEVRQVLEREGLLMT